MKLVGSKLENSCLWLVPPLFTRLATRMCHNFYPQITTKTHTQARLYNPSALTTRPSHLLQFCKLLSFYPENFENVSKGIFI